MRQRPARVGAAAHRLGLGARLAGGLVRRAAAASAAAASTRTSIGSSRAVAAVSGGGASARKSSSVDVGPRSAVWSPEQADARAARVMEGGVGGCGF